MPSLAAAEIAERHFVVSQPPLHGAPVARLRQQRQRMRRGGGNEFLALLAHLLARRRLLREMAGGRRVRLLAGVIEAFPQRLRDVRVLLVEFLPFVAQMLYLVRESRRREGKRSRGLGTLAQLDTRLVLPERFPALELRQLLRDQPPNRCSVGFGSRPASALRARISSTAARTACN